MIKKIIYAILALVIVGLTVFYYFGDSKNTGEKNAFALLKDKVFESRKEPINLIICWTPLQMVIAEKIIDQNPNEKFHTMVMSYVKNEKFEHYFNRLKNKSERAYSFYMESPEENKNYVYTSLLEVKLKSLLLPEVKTIYLSNMDKPEIHTVISSHPKAEIKTFDDGTANLIESSFLFFEEEVINDKFYKSFINPNQTPKKIKNSSAEHFTIFKDLPNIMGKYSKKLTYLPLFEYENEQNQPVKETVRILLGTVEKDLKNTSELAIKRYNIDYATLHPRQEYKLDNVRTIETELIIEDYLLQELNKKPETQYEIYTFFSGAALTIKDFPRVKVIALKPTSFPKDYWLTPVYDLFEKADIPILEFNDK